MKSKSAFFKKVCPKSSARIGTLEKGYVLIKLLSLLTLITSGSNSYLSHEIQKTRLFWAAFRTLIFSESRLGKNLDLDSDWKRKSLAYRPATLWRAASCARIGLCVRLNPDARALWEIIYFIGMASPPLVGWSLASATKPDSGRPHVKQEIVRLWGPKLGFQRDRH